ncbi:Ribonuclease H-like domain protein [Rutstroemia sp. NJR-2017a WRK4]|nr:Ribonuclease H-like domain protein [Rutstroemia sp. NJR-2017a WRK4]
MIQIKRIRYSIHPLTTTPYSVEISKLSKELEAENYKNSAILLAPNQYSIYTNKSELENQKEIEIGLALFNSNYLKNFKPSSRKRIQIPISTKRTTTSTFYQLKIRYSYLKSYLYLLGYISTNKYICGVKKTSEYLLLSYSYFSLARNKLKDKLVINYLLLPLLLNTTPGIEVSIAYLSETNIYTRKYYLARELVDD